jgi:hypothetical protein
MNEYITRNGVILNQIRKEEKLAQHFWHAANYVADPKQKKKLTEKALRHYTVVVKLKRTIAA